MQYYGSAVILQLAFAYLFSKALSVLAALQETTEVTLSPGVSPCRLGGLLALTALLSRTSPHPFKTNYFLSLNNAEHKFKKMALFFPASVLVPTIADTH